jgi:hypothetical protein
MKEERETMGAGTEEKRRERKKEEQEEGRERGREGGICFCVL